MTETDRPQFGLAIAALCETLGKQASEAMLYGYWLALSDLPLAAVQRAVMRGLRENKFMPSPAELRQLAGEATPEDRAILAWASVEKATAIGAYKSVDFSDPIINAAIRTLGGWPAILEKPAREFDTFVRAAFLKAYASLSRSGATGDVCAPLPGLSHQGEHQVPGIGGRTSAVRIGVTKIKALSENGGSSGINGRQLPRLHAEPGVEAEASKAAS